MNNTKTSNAIPALLIALGIIIGAGIWGYAFYSVRSFDNTLSATGSAKTQITSDTVKWTLNISRKTIEPELKQGYQALDQDLQAAVAFLKENSVTDEEIETSQVFVNEVYKYNQNDYGPREYNLQQTITVQSSKVKEIDTLAKNINGLVNKGVFVSSNYLEFYISQLPELRVSLLADAIKDAKARVEQIAQSNGQAVGSLKAATSGVTQVLAPNSIDISDYGQYNTQSIEKEVMITVRATFFLK